MIDRFLLLRQAKRFRISPLETGAGKNVNDRIVNEYIEKRIKAVIYISFEKMQVYYRNNMDLYGKRKFYEVKEEIEAEMINKELKNRLKKHVSELRGMAHIRVQLEE